MGVSVNLVDRTSLVCGPRGQREWEVGQSPRFQEFTALTRLTSWEVLMSTIVKLICVMAGAARLWKSGDEFYPCERRTEVGSHDLLHESAPGRFDSSPPRLDSSVVG